MLTPADAVPLYLVVLYLVGHRPVRQREQAARDRVLAVDAERHRILHDLHDQYDGMRAQLITALRLAERSDTDRRLVARGIQDAGLRLVIDSLHLADGDLLPLLGNLRYRLQEPLKAVGIELTWQVREARP